MVIVLAPTSLCASCWEAIVGLDFSYFYLPDSLHPTTLFPIFVTPFPEEMENTPNSSNSPNSGANIPAGGLSPAPGTVGDDKSNNQFGKQIVDDVW